MKRRRRLRKAIFAAFLLLPVAAATGCRAHLVRVSVVNKTGAAANLVEVDYPSASFGIDILPAGAVYRCRLQLLDSGPLSVQFTGADRHQHKIAGPTVEQPEEGSLEIDLLPGGKAEFHPRLTMPR